MTLVDTLNLEPTAVEQYHAQGFLCPLPSIGEAAAADILRRLEEVERTYGGRLPKHMLLKPHLLFPWLHDLIRHRAIVDVVSSLLGPDILCWSTRFFIKEPGDGGFLPWHQDVTYWGVDTQGEVVTAWVALTSATRENGVMKVVPGTHTRLVRHREGATSSMLVRGQEIAVTVDETQAVYMELRPGEMSLHHGLLFHASDANVSTRRRVGFAIRYIPTGLKPLPDLPRDNATLVRGVDLYGHFDREGRPGRDLDEEAIAEHERVSKRYAEIHDHVARRHASMTAEV